MGEGDDHVRLLAGLVTVYGEGGNDLFEIWSSDSRAEGGSGDDLFTLYGGARVNAGGGVGDERFVFEAALADVWLEGGAGDDEFDGAGLSSTGQIHGGAGDDRLSGFGAGVLLAGEAGDDSYHIDPAAGAVVVERPREGLDTLVTGGGADVTLPTGVENLVIGTGSTAMATLVGNLLDNKMAGGDASEAIHGLDGDDALYANGGDDVLDGGRGDDLLHGGSGNDVLTGGTGDDRLTGGTGDDAMTGGAGNDSYRVDSAGDLVSEAPDEGTDIVYSAVAAYALPENVESGMVDLASGAQLDGNGLDNWLAGGDGADVLAGLGGSDSVQGGNGNDRVSGGSGDDQLAGEDGDDRLQGDEGVDALAGGAGADTFVFLLAGDSAAGDPDTIADFTPDEGDAIDLSAIDANVAIAGDQAFAWAETTPTANALWYSYSENADGSWEVAWFADVDGDAIADFELHVHQVGFLTIGTDILL